MRSENQITPNTAPYHINSLGETFQNYLDRKIYGQADYKLLIPATRHIYKYEGKPVRVRTINGFPMMAVPDMFKAAGLSGRELKQYFNKHDGDYFGAVSDATLTKIIWKEGKPIIRQDRVRMMTAEGIDSYFYSVSHNPNFRNWAVDILKRHINDNYISEDFKPVMELDRIILKYKGVFVKSELFIFANRYGMNNAILTFCARLIELRLPPVKKYANDCDLLGTSVIDMLSVYNALNNYIKRYKNNPQVNNFIFAERLRSLRQSKGLTEKELADDVMVKTGMITEYEGAVLFPYPDVIIRLCKYFGVTVEYLMGLTDDIPVGLNNPDSHLESA